MFNIQDPGTFCSKFLIAERAAKSGKGTKMMSANQMSTDDLRGRRGSSSSTQFNCITKLGKRKEAKHWRERADKQRNRSYHSQTNRSDKHIAPKWLALIKQIQWPSITLICFSAICFRACCDQRTLTNGKTDEKETIQSRQHHQMMMRNKRKESITRCVDAQTPEQHRCSALLASTPDSSKFSTATLLLSRAQESLLQLSTC